MLTIDEMVSLRLADSSRAIYWHARVEEAYASQGKPEEVQISVSLYVEQVYTGRR